MAVTHSVFCGTLTVPCFEALGSLQLSLEPPHWVCCTCPVPRPMLWGRVRDALTIQGAAVGDAQHRAHTASGGTFPSRCRGSADSKVTAKALPWGFPALSRVIAKLRYPACKKSLLPAHCDIVGGEWRLLWAEYSEAAPSTGKLLCSLQGMTVRWVTLDRLHDSPGIPVGWQAG